MTRLLNLGTALALGLGLSAPALHAADALPEAYALIAKRNIFDPERTPARPYTPRPTGPAVERPPEPKIDSLALVGVVVLSGKPSAYFSGSNADLGGRRDPEAVIGGLRIVSIATDEVVLEATGDAGETRYSLRVGQGLSRTDGGPWTLVDAPVRSAGASASSYQPSSATSSTTPSPATGASASTPAATPTSSATPAAGGPPSDLLERLRKRREQEMNK